VRAFDFAANQPWAIREENLQFILDVAQRQHQPDFEAVAMKRGKAMDERGMVEMRGDVAVIKVTGPVFRYANLFTEISGATSIENLAVEFAKAVENPAVRAIVLNIDSPGGEVAGVSELAQAIYAARERKKIMAYVDALAASGGYWLASAAEGITAGDTAQLGSIGVVATYTERQQREGVKTYQFVSSVSPRKRPDLATEEGKSQVQSIVDDLAAVFVSAVARNRGVSEEKVISDFGKGGVLIASKAVSAGMADNVGTFEGLIAELQKAGSSVFDLGGSAAMKSTNEVNRMEKPTTAAESKPVETVNVAEVQAAARKSERERISAILSAEEATGREGMATHLAFSTEMSADDAKKLLAAAPKAEALKPEAKASEFEKAMAGIDNPKVGTDQGKSGAEDEQALVQSVLKVAGIRQEVK
jgi:capsid assembly protease